MSWRMLLDLIPRWETNDWAAREFPGGECDPIKTMEYVKPGEVYDGILTLSSFVWLGLCFGGGGECVLKPWINPHDKATNKCP